jgi:hypothetical protein
MEIDIESVFENMQSIEMDDNTKELLRNGIPAYIKDPDMANGIMLKLYPDGKKETVYIDDDFRESVVNL